MEDEQLTSAWHRFAPGHTLVHDYIQQHVLCLTVVCGWQLASVGC